MRILVTGGGGFIGSNIARRLGRDGHDVVAADSFLSASWKNLVDFAGDVLTLRDHDDVQSMRDVGPFDVICHQAAITGVIAPDGAVAAAAPEFTMATVTHPVQGYSGATPYVRWGNKAALGICLALIAAAALIGRRSNRSAA